MNNTDKKQPMTDEELSKISGGSPGTMPSIDSFCPFCGKHFDSAGPAFKHSQKCYKNPKRIG